MLKIAVCDDNQEELSHITALLEAYQKERGTSLSYKPFLSSVELASTAQSGGYSLYLLDAIMPALDGIGLAKEIRSFDKAASIIFLTSSPEFAVESYTVKAANYLIKPIDKAAFFVNVETSVFKRTVESFSCEGRAEDNMFGICCDINKTTGACRIRAKFCCVNISVRINFACAHVGYVYTSTVVIVKLIVMSQ